MVSTPFTTLPLVEQNAQSVSSSSAMRLPFAPLVQLLHVATVNV